MNPNLEINGLMFQPECFKISSQLVIDEMAFHLSR